jgi:hypothetical protein
MHVYPQYTRQYVKRIQQGWGSAKILYKIKFEFFYPANLLQLWWFEDHFYRILHYNMAKCKGGHANFRNSPQTANSQILGLILLSQIRKCLNCASPQMANPANRIQIESMFSSAKWFTTKFQKCSSIFVLRNGIPKVFCSAKQPEFHRNKLFASSTPPASRRIILLSEIFNPSFAFFSFPFYNFF